VSNVHKLVYPMASSIVREAAGSRLDLALEGGRAEVGLTGKVKNPELFRDAFLAAIDVMRSDLRYKGKDRTASPT
jgi:hypothetical protein